MPDSPLAYFLTWTTYGTWLHGDERGWVDGKTHEMNFEACPDREHRDAVLMTESAVTLTATQRQSITTAIAEHCRIRGWDLHTVNVRSQHVHVVLSCPCASKRAMSEFKSYGTRLLKRDVPSRQNWWTEGGSNRYIWNEDDLERVIIYVRDMQ